MIRLFAFITMLLLSLLLSGCAGLRSGSPAYNQPLTWQAREVQLNRITAWNISGSVSIQRPERADIASLDWTQQNRNYTLALSGPLNLSSVEITGRPGFVTLKQPDRPPASAQSPELLMQRQLGWQIPISDLYYWVRGLPTPNAPAKMQFDEYNHLALLKQRGWTIQYLNFTNAGKTDLPDTILMTRGNLKVKLVVRTWEIS